MLFGRRRQAADAGADDDADFVAVFLVEFEAGIHQRAPRGIDAELRVTIRAADFLRRWKRGREVEILHLPGDLRVERCRVEGGDPVNATLAGDEAVPKNVQLMSERRDDAEAGDDHTAV